MEKVELIWMNGEFVAWDEANVHVLTHGLHYGTGVFEGVRCYDTEAKGPAIFRHRDHLERLKKSAELYYLPLEHSLEEIGEATKELIRRNGLRSCYIRPLAFRGYGEMGLYAQSAPVEVIVAVWPWGAYLGEEGKQKGIRAKVSSWRRISPAGLIPHAKASGQYLNSILAKTESANAGYDEAILLDERGFVCEGSGENIFVISDGRIVTPPPRGLDPRRDQPQVGDADRRGPRLPGGRARRRPRRALPGRRDLPHGHGGRAGARCARSTTTTSADRARSPARSRPSTRTRCTAAPRSTSSGSTRSASRPARHRPNRSPARSRPRRSGSPHDRFHQRSSELRGSRPPEAVTAAGGARRPPRLWDASPRGRTLNPRT